jgi:hypothetical protein
MNTFMEKIDRLLMASVMAEAGAQDLGRAYLDPQRYGKRPAHKKDLKDFLKNVGLQDVRVYYGVAQF